MTIRSFAEENQNRSPAYLFDHKDSNEHFTVAN
jgi:hypothetical protein